MAKKTKDSNLSLEERLEQALIPNWDEPYKLPENWCWTHWGNCGQFIAGGAFKEKYQGFSGLPIPFYKVGSLKYSDNNGYLYDETNTVDEEIRNQLKVALIPVNSIVFAKIGEAIRLNRRSLNANPCCIDNNLMAFVTSDKCYYKYVYYWSKSIDLYEYANATTVPAIRKSDLESIPFPLAPYDTQVKIVNYIESLFSKLDEAKEKAQEVVDGFEPRKAAILNKAFSGELTAKWRVLHNKCYEDWEMRSIGEIATVKGGKRIPKGMTLTSQNTGHPYIKAGNLKNGTVIDDGIMYVPDDVLPYIKNYTVNAKDVYITNVGACIGDCGIVPAKYHGANLTENAVKITNCNCDEEYLALFLSCNMVQQRIKELTASATLGKLSIANIKTIEVNLPSYEEQKELVKLLDVFIKKEQGAKEYAEAVIEQIDTIKKAILARAFRGELGTNDPSEESAVELLKKVLCGDGTVQTPAKMPTKRISIPSNIKELLSNIREEEIIKLLLKSAPQPVSIQEIMSLSSKKFELMDALRSLEKKQLITKNESGEYSLTR